MGIVCSLLTAALCIVACITFLFGMFHLPSWLLLHGSTDWEQFHSYLLISTGKEKQQHTMLCQGAQQNIFKSDDGTERDQRIKFVRLLEGLLIG
jgi:hypothetical protein